MKFIKRHLLSMNKKMEVDPILLECCKKLFEFANDIGLKGIKVKDLGFKEEQFKEGDWLPHMFYCMQEEIEEKTWEENNK